MAGTYNKRASLSDEAEAARSKARNICDSAGSNTQEHADSTLEPPAQKASLGEMLKQMRVNHDVKPYGRLSNASPMIKRKITNEDDTSNQRAKIYKAAEGNRVTAVSMTNSTMSSRGDKLGGKLSKGQLSEPRKLSLGELLRK